MVTKRNIQTLLGVEGRVVFKLGYSKFVKNWGRINSKRNSGSALTFYFVRAVVDRRLSEPTFRLLVRPQAHSRCVEGSGSLAGACTMREYEVLQVYS